MKPAPELTVVPGPQTWADKSTDTRQVSARAKQIGNTFRIRVLTSLQLHNNLVIEIVAEIEYRSKGIWHGGGAHEVQTPYCQNFADIEQSIMSAFESIHFKISRQLNGEDWILFFYRSISRQFQSPSETSHNATRLGTADQEYDLGTFFSRTISLSIWGGAKYRAESNLVKFRYIGRLQLFTSPKITHGE